MEHADDLTRCVNEFATLLQLANFTLWAGVIAAIAISLLTIIERIVAMKKRPLSEAGAGGAGIGTLLDSIKGLVTALAAAPPWFAIFLAGVLLLWCAGKFTPVECRKQLQTVENTVSPDGHAKSENGKN
jgi:hypothetical protein